MAVASTLGTGAIADRSGDLAVDCAVGQAFDRAGAQPATGLLARFGVDPIAASIAQRGVELLTRVDGLLGFRRAGKVAVSLGGAVGERATQLALWRDFLRDRHAMGSYLSSADVAVVRAVEPAIYVVPFGAEYVVSPRAALAAIPRAAASAARKAARKGLVLDEVGTFKPWRTELAQINARFVERSPIGEELEFLNRPALLEHAPARRFLIRRAAALLGFVELDRAPAEPHHYLLNIIRFDRCNIWGVYHWVVHELVHRLAGIDGAELSLGFSPMSPRALVAGETYAPALVRRQVEFLMARRHAFHGFDAIEDMKAAWPHELRARHLAFRTRNVIAAGHALCGAMGMPWQRVALRRLAGTWRNFTSRG